MHKNEQLIRDAYEAYGRGDMPAVTKTWTDDIVWHFKGTTPLAGDYKGAEKIQEALTEIGKLTNGTFKLEVTKVFADDETGIVLCRSKSTVAGRTFDTLTTHVHRLVDGKVAETSFLFEDAVEMNAAQLEALAAASA